MKWEKTLESTMCCREDYDKLLQNNQKLKTYLSHILIQLDHRYVIENIRFLNQIIDISIIGENSSLIENKIQIPVWYLWADSKDFIEYNRLQKKIQEIRDSIIVTKTIPRHRKDIINLLESQLNDLEKQSNEISNKYIK